jgi:hypothetical protein
MSNPRLFSFVGSNDAGEWRVQSIEKIKGDKGVAHVTHVSILSSSTAPPTDISVWTLKGATSNTRYVTREEMEALVSHQVTFGSRPEATCAAIILISKDAKWWSMTQDERRRMFEETSKHNTIGMKALPAIARRLHHCRDLEAQAEFDFITLFDFAPEHEAVFNQLLAELRATEEWGFISSEVEIRLMKA